VRASAGGDAPLLENEVSLTPLVHPFIPSLLSVRRGRGLVRRSPRQLLIRMLLRLNTPWSRRLAQVLGSHRLGAYALLVGLAFGLFKYHQRLRRFIVRSPCVSPLPPPLPPACTQCVLC
jgi:hypothetical protein